MIHHAQRQRPVELDRPNGRSALTHLISSLNPGRAQCTFMSTVSMSYCTVVGLDG